MLRKFILFTLLGFCSIGQSIAQPTSGIAPNFTLKDLNGNWHTLYDYLDQGKTVFIDFSAAWCNPCWNFHNGHALHSLYAEHGPSGMPGVNANTTNDVMVFFLESEPNNSVAQLYGVQGTGNSGVSQGNWVSGTPFPIIDTNAATTNAILSAWNVGSFPTILMICRDRMVQKLPQLSTQIYYNGVLFNCPNYPPSSGVDAKVLPYRADAYYFCNAKPQIKFQNYSQTNNITNATIKFFENNNQVYSHNWTGNLAPYAVATFDVPAFPLSSWGGYKYKVEVTGDSNPNNHTSADSVFYVYSNSNAMAIPMEQDFEFNSMLPYKFKSSGNGFDVELLNADWYSTPIKNVIGISGNQTRAARFRNRLLWWYKTIDLIIGNYNTNVNDDVFLEFDVAFAQVQGNENDTLEVMISTDCGVSWSSPYIKSGNDLKTTAPVGNFKDFFPQAANQWRRESVNLSNFKSQNTIIKFRTHANMGNDIWIDNLKLVSRAGTTGLSKLQSKILDAQVYPNPVNNELLIEITANKSFEGLLKCSNLLGQVVSEQKIDVRAGNSKFNMDLSKQNTGNYVFELITANGETLFRKKISIVK